MKETGFYIIKDKFFEDMPDPYLKGNKAGNRPPYYCFEDTTIGIYWMIPLLSRVDKYKRIADNKAQAGKPCDIRAKGTKGIGDAKAWCEVYTATARCAVHIEEITGLRRIDWLYFGYKKLRIRKTR